MRLQIHRVKLPLKKTFRISRGSLSIQESVIIELHDQGESGLGEAVQSSYYRTTADSIVASLQKLEPDLSDFEFDTPEKLWDFARPRVNGDSFALSALDQAAHDLFGKLHHTRVFERYGLQWKNIPRSSITVSIDDPAKMLEELHQYEQWPIIKVKLGSKHDVSIIKALREHSDAVFRVDANGAWTADETIRNSEAFANLGVEFIEQPLPATASQDDMRLVFEKSALPVIADESCRQEEDVCQVADFFHGINVKLCKCGGLTPALRMLAEAESLGLKKMAGCMIESDVAISAAAQLLPLLDYADLDGSVLLTDQPARGILLRQGVFSSPRGHGCGVRFAESMA